MKDFACTLRRDGATTTVKARLEDGQLHVRGKGLAFAVPFAAFTSLGVAGTWLELDGPEGPFALGLGERAPIWAARIRGIKDRVRRLGVKPGTNVGVMGVPPDDMRTELLDAGAVFGSRPYDVMIAFMQGPPNRDYLEVMLLSKAPEGVVWFLRPKELPLADVRAALAELDLIDVAAMKWDESWLAERWVYPRQIK